MNSSSGLPGTDKNVSKEFYTSSPAAKSIYSRPSPLFSPSSSLSSCSSSNFHGGSPVSPATSLQFSGIPFSWEQLPGIPKKQGHNKKDSTIRKLLPLPPPATPPSKRFNFEPVQIRKKISIIDQGFQRDPFFAAFIECSKDDQHQEPTSSDLWTVGANKVSRSVSDRFGFINLNTFCKRTCAVSESIVYIPRSNRSSYDLITRRNP